MTVNCSQTLSLIGNPRRNKTCRTCGLCSHQFPLLSEWLPSDIFWVGLSAVHVGDGDEGLPLSKETRSGQLIHQIEEPFVRKYKFYKTNLVKCLPLRDGKIRYPSSTEMEHCFPNLETEIQSLKPRIVFLLGKQVSSFVIGKKIGEPVSFKESFEYTAYNVDGVLYIPIHHPSFILVYKRKYISEYIKNIQKAFTSPRSKRILKS